MVILLQNNSAANTEAKIYTELANNLNYSSYRITLFALQQSNKHFSENDVATRWLVSQA